MQKFARLISAAALAVALLALPACSVVDKAKALYTQATNPLDTTDAVKALAVTQQVHQIWLLAATTYLNQPACGLEGSPMPPLCASYAIGLQMQKADDVFNSAVSSAQAQIDAMQGNTTAVQAAVATVKAALATYQAVLATYNIKPAT